MIYTKATLMRIATEELMKELVKEPRYVLTNSCYSGYGDLSTIFCTAEIPGWSTNRIYIGLKINYDDSRIPYASLVKFKDSNNLQEEVILIDQLYSLESGLVSSNLFTTEKADMVKSLARRSINRDTAHKFSFTVSEDDPRHEILHAMITAHTGRKISKKQQFYVDLMDSYYQHVREFMLGYTYRNEHYKLRISNK